MAAAERETEQTLDPRLLRTLELIAQGEPVSKACKAGGFARCQLYRLIDGEEGDPIVRDKYARAREWQADAHFDRIVESATWLEHCAKQGVTPDGTELTQAMVNAWRATLDAQKWAASKLRPKVYGDRLEVGGKVEHSHTHTLTPVAPELLGALQSLGAQHARLLLGTGETLDAEVVNESASPTLDTPKTPDGGDGQEA
jgi:hypothetical protein